MIRLTAWVMLLVFAGTIDAQTSDAATQYRVARRLVAEGSPGAGQALERVVALDPEGPLADDALLDRAELIGVPHWPEDLARVTVEQATRTRPILERIVDNLPAGDRTAEARQRLSLLMLAPLPGRDPERARLSLLSLAATDTSVSSSARYALAWTAEQGGDLGRAEAAYQRIRVEAPGTEVSARAAAGFGRLRLREGKAAEAAAAFQQALDAGTLDRPTGTTVAALRDVAVDALLRRVTTVEALRVGTGTRPSAVAAMPGGGALIAQRKAGIVTEYDAAATSKDRWTMDQPLAVAVTSSGLRLAVTPESVLRLEPGGRVVVVALPGDMGSFAGAVAGDDGRLWVLGRKGERLGSIEPGAEHPEPLWRGDGVRLTNLAWDGNRLLAVDSRARSVVAIHPDGSLQTVIGEGLDRPSAIAVDAAGRIAVLESRGARVRFFDARGGTLGAFDTQQAGMQRATGLSLGLGGALQLVEERSGVWWRAE